MADIKSKLQDTLGFLKKAAKRQPKPICPNPELPEQLPTAAQLTKIDQHHKIKKSPLIALWPDNQQRPDDADREAPYVTRGRYAEINRLIELLENPPRAIHLITGPPGSGKSTLLETIAEYASRQGFLPVKILPETFLHPTTVIEEIRRQTLGAALAGSRLDIETHQDVMDETHVGGDAGIVKGGHKRTVQDGQKQQRHEVGNPQLLRHLHEIIAILKEEYDHIRGILIYCDEFQKLHRHSHESANEHLTLRPQFYTLNEQLRRNKPPLPIITLLAGIPPAHDTLQNLLSRKSITTTIELLPVDGYPVHDPRSPHCTFILHDHLRASQKALGHNLRIPLALLHIWGMECRGHVLHANHAGSAIQQQLEEFNDAGRQELNSVDFESIDEAISNQRENYYRERFESIYTNLPHDTTKEEMLDVTEHVIVAMHNCSTTAHSLDMPHFLTWNTIWAIAAQALPNQNRARADRLLEHLQHKGIIGHMRNDGRFLHYKASKRRIRRNIDNPPPDSMPYADCPIPTLSAHIRNTITPTRMARIQENIERAIQEQDHLATTQWHWVAEVSMKKITEVKPVDYIAPVFPRVLTPREASEEAYLVAGEIERDPDAQATFIKQCSQDIRANYRLIHDNYTAIAEPQTPEPQLPEEVNRNGNG